MFVFAAAGRVAAMPAGPTLHLDYGHGQPLANPISQFMYFVPLISPEPVVAFTNAGNTQCARVTSSDCRVSGGTFVATCKFEFIGTGSQRNVLDHANLIRQHENELKAGGSLKRQLGCINVKGGGSGRVEIEGTVTNGIRSVNEVRMCFNDQGKPSPVTITLQDIVYRDGAVRIEDKLVAQVNALTFRRAPGAPRMEVTLASLKRAGAGNNIWQNSWGDLKGMVADQFMPPITIAAAGHKAMLDFGLALADKAQTFTFPRAKNLETTP